MENNSATLSFSKIARKICHEIFFLALSALLLGIFAESLLPGLLNDKKILGAIMVITFGSATGIVYFSRKNNIADSVPERIGNSTKTFFQVTKKVFYLAAYFLAAATVIISLRRFGWSAVLIFGIFIWISILLYQVLNRN